MTESDIKAYHHRIFVCYHIISYALLGQELFGLLDALSFANRPLKEVSVIYIGLAKRFLGVVIIQNPARAPR